MNRQAQSGLVSSDGFNKCSEHYFTLHLFIIINIYNEVVTQKVLKSSEHIKQ